LKRAARGSLKIQHAENRQKFTIWAPSHNFVGLYPYIFATKACIGNRKKLLNSNTSLTRSYNMVNFGPLAAEIGSGVWDIPANFNVFRVLALLAALLHGTLVMGVSQICGVEHRAPPVFGRAAITVSIGPHSSLYNFCRKASITSMKP